MIMLTILLVIDSMFEPINLPQFMSHRKKRNPRDKVAQQFDIYISWVKKYVI